MVRTLHRTRRLVVVLTSAALAVTGLSVGSLALGASSAAASDSSMFGQVNASRAAKGLSAYTWNSHLAAVAGEQAARMANRTKLYHNPNLASDVGNYRWVGENVGYGPSSSSIQKAFMNSTGHRANILDRSYTQIGIASVRDDGGRLWVAQVFRQPSGSSGDSTKSSKASSSTKKAEKKSKPAATAPKKRSTAPARRTVTAAPKPAPKPAARPAAPSTPKATAPAPAPAPTPTLADRVSYATSGEQKATDPIADAMAFAATMNAIGG